MKLSAHCRLPLRFLLSVACALYALNLYHLTPCDDKSNSNMISDITKRNLGTKTEKKTAGELDDICATEYDRVTATSRTPGLTLDDLERSRAFTGNRQRLAKFSTKLSALQSPVNVIVCGGSISLGHGVTPVTARYSDQLQVWLNDYYPISTNEHRVYNFGSHGADVRV